MSPLILLAIALGTLPTVQPISSPALLPGETAEITSTPSATRPTLIPGYPARVSLPLKYRGLVYSVWGWTDTEKVVHWFPSENPHVPYIPDRKPEPEAVPEITRNFGLDLKSLHSNAIGGTLTTNDPVFAATWNGVSRLNAPATFHPEHDPVDRCPGPGPCPYPNPRPTPPPAPPDFPPDNDPADLGRWIVPGILAGIAAVVILVALTRKASDAPR